MINRKKIIPIFLPQDSCRHNCTFCNQEAVVGRKQPMGPEEVKEFIKKCLITIKSSNHRFERTIEVAFYGGSFTELPETLQEAYLLAASEAVKDNRFYGIRISTRPDSINRSILKLLKQYKVTMVELGVQSMDDRILKKINRGHTSKDTTDVVNLLHNFGFQVGIQLMIGLPGESNDSLNNTAEKVIKLSPQTIRLHPTLVIKETPLAKLYYTGQYKPIELHEAIDICKKLVVQFERKGIKIIRIGLQASSSLESPGTIVAGPYHPSFGQLVRGAIFFDLIIKALEKLNINSQERVVLRASSSNLSYLVGLKKENISRLHRSFGFQHIKIDRDEDIKENTISLQMGKHLVSVGYNELNYRL